MPPAGSRRAGVSDGQGAALHPLKADGLKNPVFASLRGVRTQKDATGMPSAVPIGDFG
jgi:hypothetical protein